MLVLIPKVNYFKGANLSRFRGMSPRGRSLWRAMKWKGGRQTAVIKEDKLSTDISTTADFIIFYR